MTQLIQLKKVDLALRWFDRLRYYAQFTFCLIFRLGIILDSLWIT